MLDRPILVTGSPRSGKTLVAEIVSRSPEFFFACEPLMLWDAVMPNRDDDRRTEADIVPGARERLLETLSKTVQRAGRTRYIDDLSQHSLRIPFIASILPEARIIHVVRDGRSVVPELIRRWSLRDTLRAAVRRRWRHVHLGSLPRHFTRFAANYWSTRIRSRRVTWGPRVPGLAEFASTHSIAQTAAFQWRNLVETARTDLARLPASRWMEVRYERLAAEPAAVAREVAAFCGASDPDACAAAATSIVRPRWTDPLTESSDPIPWDDVAHLIAPLQRELAYGSPRPKVA